jgi:hypothetical protein
MDTASFSGVKGLGRGVAHTPPSKAEVKEKVELSIYSPSGPSWFVSGLFFTVIELTICIENSVFLDAVQCDLEG